MLLHIKSQGFPNVLNQLGIQSPLQGPFWGFESTVLPTYQIGCSSIQPTSVSPFKNIDQDTQGILVAPLAIDVIAYIGGAGYPLQRGFYAYEIDFWWVCTGAATSNQFALQFWDATKTTARDLTLVGLTGGSTVPPASGQRQFRSTIEITADGDYGELTMAANGHATLAVYAKTKWRFLGREFLP